MILQVEFQQSKLYVWMVAQIQFIDRVLQLPLVQQRSVPTAQTVQKTVEIPQLLFLGAGGGADAAEAAVGVEREGGAVGLRLWTSL